MRTGLVAAALMLPLTVFAQGTQARVNLSGRVIDGTDSGGIARAIVTVAGTKVRAYSDAWGHFDLRGIPAGQQDIVVHALGYAKLTQSELLSPHGGRADFYMMRLPHELSEVRIEGRGYRVPRGFEEIYRRGLLGFGYLITREQIDSVGPPDLRMMLDFLPGVVTNDQGVFFATCRRPSIWVDGQPMSRYGPNGDPAYKDFLEYMSPSDVQVMEVYTRSLTVPAEYDAGQACGVIAIWTKRGP